jgi:2-dehydropantoate 2-reductase
MEKHVYIIGAGAIGKALAVFLKLNQQMVTLLRGSVDNGVHSFEKISVVLDGKVLETDIQISSLSNFQELDGIVILTSKSFGNENLAEALKAKSGHSPIVLLQNGLGVEQAFIEHHFPEIYRCVLFVTSQIMENGEIRFKPVSECPVGTIKGSGLFLNEVINALSTTWFRFVAEPNIHPVIWKKAIVNSVFNSVCPLLEIDNGIFHRDAMALELADRIITECLLVATENGILLSKDEVLESLLRISRFSDGQLISTLQDIRLGRRTEIGTLNGAIVTLAGKLNMAHLVTETRLLWEMTRLKEELNLKTEQNSL